MKAWKLSGAGNDFVLVEGPVARPEALARRLCKEHRVDGLLVATRGRVPEVLHVNNDGSPAFCGNGSRCAAWWMRRRGWFGARAFRFRSNGALLRARGLGRGRVAIRMPRPSKLAFDRRLNLYVVDTGAPHAVLQVADIDTAPLRSLGPRLRRALDANVDFMELRGGKVRMRSYERGVEDETLACGTGAVAVALVARALGRAGARVDVVARGGDRLTVVFEGRRPWLEGPVRLIP